MSADKIFVDTNVFVYARDASEPEKQPRAAAWVDALWASRQGRLSAQVLHEYYVTVTRKLRPGLPPEVARRDVRGLSTWGSVPHSLALLEIAWGLEERYELSWWDALIVAAARQAGCSVLLTEDLQDGQGLAGVRVVNPFVHAAADLLGR